MICRLTGAEAALVVNNNAGAVLLVLKALASGREAVISRGQLVEIGGGFRIPDVMIQSGARLVEVGSTNRAYERDFEAAVGPATGMLLSAHRSNFQMSGFTAGVRLEELVAQAVELEFSHLALTDTNALYGAMEFDRLAREAGLEPIIGAVLERGRQRAVEQRVIAVEVQMRKSHQPSAFSHERSMGATDQTQRREGGEIPNIK